MMVFCCCLLSAAMTWSLFLMSIAMWGFVLIAFSRFDSRTLRMRFVFESEYKILLQRLVYASVTVPFFLVLISGLWSHDIFYWLERLRIRLPFLILPVAFYYLPALNRKQFYSILYFTLLFVSCFTIFILVNYFLHFSEITELLNRGNPVPFMRDHIRYSIQLCFTIFISFELIRQKFYWINEKEQTLLKILSGFLIVSLHVIAVRSGLLIFYASLFIFFFLWSFKKKRVQFGLIGLLLTVSVPFLAYRFVPSFHNKINYARWDFLMYQKGEGADYSDAGRLISLKVGTQVFINEPIFGVGAGDLYSEVGKIYTQQYSNWSPKLPHNQLLIIAAGTGLVGLFLFIIGFFFPLFADYNFRNLTLVLFFYLNVFISFWIDMPFDAAFGVAFYVFYVCFFWRYKNQLT